MKYLVLTLTAFIAISCLWSPTCIADEITPAAQSDQSDSQEPVPLAQQLRLQGWQPGVAQLSVLKNNAPLRPGPWAGDPPKFFAGALVGFLGHESGHVIANYALDTSPYLKSVNYGPIPFFTIEPGRSLTNREHYIIASAGFNAENLIDEWLLSSHPDLKGENEPFLKGIAAFNFWLNVGYAASAFAGTGPNERDTKGMADSLGWNERWVGAMILVPTALDTYRYKHPEAKWAVTASRVAKLLMIGLALKASD